MTPLNKHIYSFWLEKGRVEAKMESRVDDSKGQTLIRNDGRCGKTTAMMSPSGWSWSQTKDWSESPTVGAASRESSYQTLGTENTSFPLMEDIHKPASDEYHFTTHYKLHIVDPFENQCLKSLRDTSSSLPETAARIHGPEWIQNVPCVVCVVCGTSCKRTVRVHGKTFI